MATVRLVMLSAARHALTLPMKSAFSALIRSML